MRNQFINLSVLMLIVAVTMFHWSCNDEQEDGDSLPVLSVTPSVTKVVFSADGASATSDGSLFNPRFTVETNHKIWYAKSNMPWVEVFRPSNLSNYFTISVMPVTGRAPEAAEVTVTAGEATVKIVVQQLSAALIPVTGITASDLDLEVGTISKIWPTLLPTNTNEENVTLIWETSNPDIVSVDDDGVVEAVSNGYATITVMLERNPSIKLEIPVGVYRLLGGNIVLNKPVTVSDITAGYPGEKAVDGIREEGFPSSRWVSADNTNEHWIEIDLQGTFTIYSYALWLDYSNSSQKMPQFCLQAWIDDAWEDVVCEENNTHENYKKEFEPVTTDKVRWCLPPYANNRVRLFEIEVYTTEYKFYE